jgi:glycosyltransferase involved in cell wall biosynthesis
VRPGGTAAGRRGEGHGGAVTDPPLTIAQVNATEQGGGAERVARQLLRELRARGQKAHMIVGRGHARAEHVHAFPAGWRTTLAHTAAGSLRILDRWRGLETYRYPATHRMLDVLPARPDIVHLHNLHGGYFDLRALPDLSRRHVVVMTLHDAWLLSGHCAHSMGCERWRTGCGACPDLTIYPAVRRDATADNWRRKQDIFRRSRLHVATPSKWLADQVEASILAPAIEDLQVIPNGVELETFQPGDLRAARAALGLAPDGPVLLFVGASAGTNPFKDFATARAAAARAAELLDRHVTLLVLGGDGPDERDGRLAVRNIPFQADHARVTRYYQACDLYVHAARADTFPGAVIEALACGRPVVATAVGGIPEQVRSYSAGAQRPDWPVSAGDEATGVLVPPADPEAMGHVIAELLEHEPLRLRLGDNAARDARRRFDVRIRCGEYLTWYRALLARRGAGDGTASPE